MEISDWIALGELIVGIIGIVVGVIGGKELKEANKLKIQFKNLNTRVDKIEVNNSQILQIINNKGLGYRDVKELAEDVVDKKTINKPDIIISEEEPKTGDIWIQPYD